MAYHLLTIHEVVYLSFALLRVSTRVHTHRVPARQQHLCKHSKSGTSSRYAFHRIDLGFSCGEPKYRICFCGLHFWSTWKKKKKNSRPIVLKFHFSRQCFSQQSCRMFEFWVKASCQNVSILYGKFLLPWNS